MSVHVWGEDLTGVVIIITVASEGDVLGIGVRVGLGLLDEGGVVDSIGGDGDGGGLLGGHRDESNNGEGVFHLLVVK